MTQARLIMLATMKRITLGMKSTQHKMSFHLAAVLLTRRMFSDCWKTWTCWMALVSQRSRATATRMTAHIARTFFWTWKEDHHINIFQNICLKNSKDFQTPNRTQYTQVRVQHVPGFSMFHSSTLIFLTKEKIFERRQKIYDGTLTSSGRIAKSSSFRLGTFFRWYRARSASICKTQKVTQHNIRLQIAFADQESYWPLHNNLYKRTKSIWVQRNMLKLVVEKGKTQAE